MAVFFVDPYLKFYEALSDLSSLNQAVSSINDDITLLKNNITTLEGQIDVSRWKEAGQDVISKDIFPLINAKLSLIGTDVTDVLGLSVSYASKLYGIVSNLKKYDELYENSLKDLELLNNKPRFSEENTSTESIAHYKWRLSVDSKKGEINYLIEECKKLQMEALDCVILINSLNVSDDIDSIVVEEVAPSQEVVQNVLYTVDIPGNISQTGYTVTGYDKWINSGKEMVWMRGTNQRALSDIWKSQGSIFKNGIAVINVDGIDRYLIATSSKYGNVGDRVTVHFQNGTSIPCIIADQKSSGDSNYNEYGHMYGNQVNILEFEVERSKYNSSGNPTTSKWGLEWDSSSPVMSIDNNGTIL